MSRILLGFGTDPSTTSTSLCKLRIYIVFALGTISVWCIAFAAVDRYFCSCQSVYLRNLSSLKVSYRVVAATTATSLLIYAEMFYCYEANQITGPFLCNGKDSPCRYFNSLIYTLFFIVLPLMVMVVFGILTLSNVRKLNRLVAPASSTTRGSTTLARTVRSKKSDKQLTKMLLVQVLISTILTVPYSIQYLYLTFSVGIYKSPLQVAAENLCFALILNLFYWGFGMSFYIYTLTGHIFRKELKRLMKTVYENVLHLTHRN
ncbi:unnamed protein product [Didymodactylos carnosus]|uniref:G-protein coupled receptors family 1 profile domain-containing protein n=1 Tax=Didymodactylos carnosus TaxID=1234261 RepID=A0A814ZBU4_9BILA|nr:unnamed protein product [Didymodactylos carnosus]CAF4005104.1 unnamed protein product [Didymodactylos carnosus]